MLRRRILDGFFKFKIEPTTMSFAYGIQKTLTNESWLYESGTVVGNTIIVTKNNKNYYKLYGRGEGTVNIAFVNFKTYTNNQVIILDAIISSESPNDFLGICKLDSLTESPLLDKLSGSTSKSISITVPTAGSHFVKVYYYQHNDGVTAGDNAGYIRLVPYYNQYEYGYDAPATQTLKIKSYTGWTLVSKPAWVTLNKSEDNAGSQSVVVSVQGNAGVARSGNIVLKEKKNETSITVSVSQGANPHPNDIILSLEKSGIINAANSSVGIDVSLIGNTSYTISNLSSNGYTVSPMSGSADRITVTKTIANNTSSSISFRMTGNAGTVKDVTIIEDDIYCYCDCNQYNRCNCDIDTSFIHKDVTTCGTDSVASCTKHCEAYGGNPCVSHTRCYCDCNQNNPCNSECSKCICNNDINCPNHCEHTKNACSCECNLENGGTIQGTCDGNCPGDGYTCECENDGCNDSIYSTCKTYYKDDSKYCLCESWTGCGCNGYGTCNCNTQTCPCNTDTTSSTCNSNQCSDNGYCGDCTSVTPLCQDYHCECEYQNASCDHCPDEYCGHDGYGHDCVDNNWFYCADSIGGCGVQCSCDCVGHKECGCDCNAVTDGDCLLHDYNWESGCTCMCAQQHACICDATCDPDCTDRGWVSCPCNEECNCESNKNCGDCNGDSCTCYTQCPDCPSHCGHSVNACPCDCNTYEATIGNSYNPCPCNNDTGNCLAHLCQSKVDTCSCNEKTYYPHCDCDQHCQCHGYVTPVVG